MSGKRVIPPSLKDQIGKHAEIGKYDPSYHPDRFDPAGNVVAPEQIGCDCNEQPKPYDETKYREGIQQNFLNGNIVGLPALTSLQLIGLMGSLKFTG
jgi:hypothetical protein